jgi:hypothetical protein
MGLGGPEPTATTLFWDSGIISGSLPLPGGFISVLFITITTRAYNILYVISDIWLMQSARSLNYDTSHE